MPCPHRGHIMKRSKIICVMLIAVAFCTLAFADLKLRVVAVNPSETEIKTTQVKIYLPKEVSPGDIIDSGQLSLEFDEEKSIYYVHRRDVELNPRETKIFEVTIEDIWIIPESELTFTQRRTSRILDRLEESSYYVEAAQIADSIYERLDEVRVGQTDESISRESHIGLYRTNLEVLERIKKDIDRLEKLLIYVGGPPAPEMLEDSTLKSDAPSKTTTWLIIFLIIGFIGLIGMVFFFTWHKQAQLTEKIMLNARETSFPTSEGEMPDLPEEESGDER